MDVHIAFRINPFELAISLHTTQNIGQKKRKEARKYISAD